MSENLIQPPSTIPEEQPQAPEPGEQQPSAPSQPIIMEEEVPNDPQEPPQQQIMESSSQQQPKRLTSNPFTIITARTLTKKQHHKCENKICKSQGVKVLKVTDAGPHNYLCEPCNARFKDCDYCFYCHQIYFEYADGTDWIMCDKCQKWIHCDCEEKFGDSNIKVKMSKYTDLAYYCPRCKPLKPVTNKKLSSAPSRDNTKDFKDFKDKNKFVKRNDCILNGYGFYWKLKPEEIQADLEKLRKG